MSDIFFKSVSGWGVNSFADLAAWKKKRSVTKGQSKKSVSSCKLHSECDC